MEHFQRSYKTEKIRDAFEFALKWHGDQKYADVHPYAVHLYEVTQILQSFGFDDVKLLCAGWLHDVIEDTPCNYKDVNAKFGEAIAEIVYALTDELGRNRKERKERTLPKLDNFKYAQIVKLADWIANVRQCHRNGNKMYKMYQRDYKHFSTFKGQFIDLEYMWNELEALLSHDVNDFKNGFDNHHNEYDG